MGSPNFHRPTVVCILALPIICAIGSGVRAGGRLPEPGIPQSCGVQLKSHNFTVETLQQVHRLGFRVVRRGFYWTSIEKEKGVYGFDDYDPQMEHAKKLGLTVVGCLFGNNKLHENDGRGGIQTDAGRRGFAGFAAAVASRYKDHDVLWEIWNEPNVRTFWRKDGKHNSEEFAAEYTELAKAVVPAMLRADADCFVMAGSVSNYWEPSYEWTESCFKQGILKTGILGWSVHPYGVKTPEESAVGHARTRALLAKYGAAELPMLNTERGFAVKETVEGFSGGSRQRAHEFQAWHFIRQVLIDQLHGIRSTIWYEWDGAEFGIAEDNGTRPGYRAGRAMFEQLDGYRVVERLESDSDRDYVLVHENQAGQRRLAAWTSPPPGGAPDEAKIHDVAVHVVEPLGGADLEGEARKIDMTVATIRLTLSGAPQYVTVPTDVRLGRCTSQTAISIAQQTARPQAEQPVEIPAGAVDLQLFEEAAAWRFVKNTGEGAFTLGAAVDDTPVGILAYDFTKSKSRSTPYVLATVPVSIAEGARELRIHARSPIPQKLTFRVVDSTGQTHQYKGRITGTGQWEAIRIPLTRRLEHWSGAADGKIHYPIKSVVFSVPLPAERAKIGKVEYSQVVVDYGDAPAPNEQ